jgi:uncharacterized peroxidase-related enzyme
VRLGILENGHGLGTKALFALIATVSREPVLDVVKLAKYRADFYGDHMQRVTNDAMRGPSAWSVADRELMAAVVAHANRCEWCVKAHGAVAGLAYGDDAKVSAVLADLEGGDIGEPLRATLRLLRKLVRERSVSADDVRGAMAAGVSLEQIRDALGVCFAFNTTSRLADAFGFDVPSPRALTAGAKYLLARGYR